MFFFATVGNGKSVPVNPTVTAKATRAKAFELASTCLPKESGRGEPKLSLSNFGESGASGCLVNDGCPPTLPRNRDNDYHA